MKTIEERKKELLESLIVEKGGEGSRGGKVIGHTKSGKAIYAAQSAKHEKSYTSKDHEDAAYAHLDHASHLSKKGDENGAEVHTAQFDRHMATKNHKKKNEDLDAEDKKKVAKK